MQRIKVCDPSIVRIVTILETDFALLACLFDGGLC